MKIEAGMTAYVSGAGSGIGRGLARELARRGVRVGVCDISGADARETVGAIEAAGGTAIAIEADVSLLDSVADAAGAIEAAFGPVDIVCNNAGVAMHGVPLQDITPAEWDWVIGVNVYGIIHGIRVFVPKLLERGAPAWILNTASIGGFQVNPTFLTGAYSMTKYAAVALSEALQNELEGSNVGVSVLAPAAVDTRIHLTARSRPERFGGAYERPANHFMGDLIKGGATPDEIAREALGAVEAGEFYIFTHAETREWVEQRFERIRKGFARLDTGRAGADRQSEAAK